MKKVSLLIVFCVVVFLLTSCFVVTNKIDDDKIPEKEELPVQSEVVGEHELQDQPEVPETVNLTLYFPDNDALYLHAEQRQVEVHKDEHLAATVLEELFKGPTTENLSRSLDGKDLVNSVSVNDDGLCTVDFKVDFALLNSGGSARETFAIGSIVNSLCELDGIEKVKININGDSNAAFGGHFTLEAPFSPQTDLISE